MNEKLKKNNSPVKERDYVYHLQQKGKKFFIF